MSILTETPEQETEINWSTIHRTPDISIHKALNIHDFYRKVTSGSYEHFDIPIEFVVMLKEAAKAACKKGYLKYAFDLLSTAEFTFDQSWHYIQGNTQTRAEEHISVHYTHARIATLFGDFRKARKHANKALECYYSGMADPSFVINYPVWIIWGARAEAMSGLHVDHNGTAKRYYRQALELKPSSVKFSACELDLCRCLFELGRWREPIERLEAFIEHRAELFGPDDSGDYLVGYALYLLGNAHMMYKPTIDGATDIRTIEEALNFLKRSLTCFRLYFGTTHCWYGAVNDKLGLLYTDLAAANPQESQQYSQNALNHFRAALRAFGYQRNAINFKAECARVLYHTSILMDNMGKDAEWEETLMEADALQWDITSSGGWNFEGASAAEVYDEIVNPLFR
ncbi:uncharacterized protein N7515_004729 [Penicillium bovifimosum]|uniref:Uncharacterized protein n=1 Tax=Penicillium bovifimosum TaxID=126998 RepID=A0A9W9L3R7_9EURO|nr:uncharacterized protein N7515_004729 [Penicillium bovifimosum]KAJ5135451.1 hypothetical protein N7515_004729 [Penicillium bovifimosum]